MKIISYSLMLCVFYGVFNLNAQNKKHKEEYTVNSDVVIDINTRHSDIEIETWNKNKVVVEAFMVIEGEEVTKEIRDEFYEKWDFNVIGNSEEISIKSRTNSTININSFDFDDIDYEAYTYPLANFSIGSLDVLDSIDFIMPPEPPAEPMFPEIPIPPLPNLPSEFDFEAYKKDKQYLKRWKKENEDILGGNAKVKIGNNSISIKSEDATIIMNEWKHKEEYHKGIKEERKQYEKQIALARKAYSNVKQQYAKERKKNKEEVKNHLNNKLKKYKIKRTAIQKVLKERSKLKVKRMIKIKVPKSAKLNMNVKYGELSFAK